MRVAHVTPYYPPHLGGMEHVARRIAEETAAAGVEVSVLTSALPGGIPKREEKTPVTRCAAVEVGHTPVMPGLLPRLLTIPREAIVHLHVAQPLVPELVRAAAAIRGFPFLAHVHLDVGPSGPLGRLLPFYKRFFLGPVLRAAAAVVVYTPGYVPLIQKRYGVPAERIEVIPAGVDPPSSFGDRGRGEETVLFVGRLSTQKNLPLLLEALRILVCRGRPATLRIVGEGEEEGLLRRLVSELGLADRVILAGRLEGEALAREYRRASVLALPSERESFGIVLIEAMSYGTPVVATDILGLRDVVDNGVTGLLCAGVPEAFAGALEAVLADPALRERLAAAGLEEARRYDWRVIIPRYLALYDQIAGQGRRP